MHEYKEPTFWEKVKAEKQLRELVDSIIPPNAKALSILTQEL